MIKKLSKKTDTALGLTKAVRHNQLYLAYKNMSENDKKYFFLDIKESQHSEGMKTAEI